MLKIAHVSDIQIRNFSRHWEFRESFENLYVSLKEKKVDIIVLVGDIAHTKTKISPEFVQICSQFFSNLANIAPLVIIPGNHDGNLNNLTRLDALTPIVEALGNRNIQYYKSSGIYRFPNGWNGNFVHFSCFDDNWPTTEDVQGACKSPINRPISVGLYHGFVKGVTLQNGMVIEDAPAVPDFLKTVDYLMLGDVHKMQILDHEFRAAYCGSFPQQNYGESVNKGYLLWEIEDKKNHDVDFVKLPNVCPFYTLKLDDDLKIPDLTKMQPRSRVRVKSRQLSVLEKGLLRDRITEALDPNRLDFLDDVSAHSQEVQLDSESTKIESLDDLGTQEKLLHQFLEHYELSDDLIQKIFDINRRYNSHLRKEEDILRNVLYRVGKVKWSNAFSYAEDNEIDFSKVKGLLGIFGKSGVGKSSAVVDIPLYCMFNKISKRVTKNDWIINENKEFCSAEMEILLRDKLYKIERKTTTYLKSGKKTGKPVYQGRTDVNFSSISPAGHEENLNDEKRQDTDVMIQKKFGTQEDFIATSVAPQWKLLNVVESGGTDRLKLISRYFDIDIFNQKHRLAKDELKEINAKLKVYGSENLQEEVDKYEKILKEIQEKIDENDKNTETQRESISRLEDTIDSLKKQIINVSAESSDKLEERLATAQSSKDSWISKSEKGKKYREEKEKLNINDAHNHLKLWKKVLDLEEKNCQLQEDYPCLKNPDCSLATETRNNNLRIEELKKLATSSKEEAEQRCDAYQELSEKAIRGGYSSVENVDQIVQNLDETISLLKQAQKTQEENKAQLEKNKQIEKDLGPYEFRLSKVREALSESRQEALRLSREFGATESQYLAKKSAVDECGLLRVDSEAYDYFMRAMSKDGIVRQIIANNIGIINSEISKILSHGVGFTVVLEANEDGKAIDIYFKHERSPKRHIELCSGMEKTLAEIAIRAALVNITTLPRSNIFVLDESFGALDPEYMAGLTRILEYLKTLFEVVVIITHEESLKDFVDHVIDVERDESGYARLT